jgi:hypothetical protein
MKRDFIVHTVADEDVEVQVELKGQKRTAKVPGLTVEMVDMESGKAHTHTVYDDLAEARQLFVPGQELTLVIQRKSGSDHVDPKEVDMKEASEKVNQFRNEALRHEDKTDSQLEDEAKQQAAIKSGVPDPITVPKAEKK